MPKLRETDQQRRERLLLGAVGRATAESGLKSDKDVANALNISPQSYGLYKKNSYQNMNFDLACRMARKLGVTGKEWCAAAGIPYEKKEDEESV